MINHVLEKNIRLTRLLGIAGLLPFYSFCLVAWHPPLRVWALDALAAYSAMILSFLGAVHWGRALTRFDNTHQGPTLLFGVMPAVIGWLAMMLPLELSLPMLAAGLVFVWGTEQMVFVDSLPRWYRHLRHGLTAASVFAVLIGWAAAMFPLF